MKKLLLAICVVSLFTLTGCEFSVSGPQVTINGNSALAGYGGIPVAENEDEVLLYSAPTGKILTYNTKEKKVAKTNIADNYYQFGFNDLDVNLFTTGYIEGKESKIVELKDNKLNVLYELEDEGSLFPVSYKDDENIYFAKINNFTEAVLCKYNKKTNELLEIPNAKSSNLFFSAVIGDYLYYTLITNPSDSELKFDLYKMDTTSNETPTLIAQDLSGGYIYNNNGKLWISDSNFLYDFEDDTNKLPVQPLNYFYDNYLFQVSANENQTFTATDLTTKEIIKTVDNFVSFDVKDNKVTVYTTSDIVTFDLSK